jgi:ketosteroid isomerase-like protein
MPAENLEIVRRIYQDGIFDGPPEKLLELTAPEIEYVNPPEAVDPGVRRGRDGLTQAMLNISESFSAYRHELRELHDAGDSVVAVVDFSSSGRGSDVEIVQREAHTWTLRDGALVRFEWGRDVAAALKAVGLEPLR